MGFRDLHSFNLAMLGKQSWRLISNPDFLCAQVLKAKYYPTAIYLQLVRRKAHLLHGKASWLVLILLKEVTFGVLARVI